MIPFSPPDISQKAIDNVVEVLKSGWITTGPKTKQFEKLIAEYCNVPSVLCLNSATAGLEIILRWFDVKEGDEVILPAYTYSATANVIMHCGAKPVFVDVTSNFDIDPEQISRAITSKTKVIMPVDFAGMPCDYSAIHKVAEEKRNLFKPNGDKQKSLGRILVLSDSAHSFGALIGNKKAGSLTDISVFSFHAVKNLTTAEGGAVCLNLPAPFDNNEIYNELCIKTLHGQNKDALAKTKKGNWRYDIVDAGYKMNMTDIQAAIGMAQLEEYDQSILPRRKEIFDLYYKFLSPYSWANLPKESINERNTCYHLFPLRINGISEVQRDKIMEGIFNRDVSVNVHFIPVPTFSYYTSLGYKGSDYPQTMSQYSNEITLPLHTKLSDEDVKFVCDAVIASVNEVIQNL